MGFSLFLLLCGSFSSLFIKLFPCDKWMSMLHFEKHVFDTRIQIAEEKKSFKGTGRKRTYTHTLSLFLAIVDK